MLSLVRPGVAAEDIPARCYMSSKSLPAVSFLALAVSRFHLHFPSCKPSPDPQKSPEPLCEGCINMLMPSLHAPPHFTMEHHFHEQRQVGKMFPDHLLLGAVVQDGLEKSCWPHSAAQRCSCIPEALRAGSTWQG